METIIAEGSLEKPIMEFGPWLVQQMNHSGLPLYLILHPDEIDALSGSKPIGLEVNLPTGIDVYMGRDDFDRGRRKLRVDLVFQRGRNYYLVEIVDKKKISSKDKRKALEYAERFRENLGLSDGFHVIPIIVYPKESPSQAFMEIMRTKPSQDA